MFLAHVALVAVRLLAPQPVGAPPSPPLPDVPQPKAGRAKARGSLRWWCPALLRLAVATPARRLTFSAVPGSSLRPILALIFALMLTLMLTMLTARPAHAQVSGDWASERWVATWGAGPAGPPLDAATTVWTNQTLRLIVHGSIGGSRARIRLSNEMGSTPLRIGAAHLALRASGAGIVAASDRLLSFSGATEVVVAPGAAVLSDAVTLTVPPLADLAISLYLPGATRATTLHAMATQTSYVSTPGNYSGVSSFTPQTTIEQWPFLTEVALTGPSSSANGNAIAALGDSLTDGLRSSGDANRRWPDWLARRLQGVGGSAAAVGVVNRGIAGNQLLSNLQVGSLGGRSAQERFDRDVLATAGIRYLTVLIGINDILGSTASSPVSASDLIAGYRQLLARAHAKGIAVYGITMPPFEGAAYYTVEKDLVRQAANNWIRSSGEYDAVIDADRLLRDTSNTRRLAPAYDSGDHLHPNDAGYQLLGTAVPLGLFGAVQTPTFQMIGMQPMDSGVTVPSADEESATAATAASATDADTAHVHTGKATRPADQNEDADDDDDADGNDGASAGAAGVAGSANGAANAGTLSNHPVATP